MAKTSIHDTLLHNKSNDNPSILEQLDLTLMFDTASRIWAASLWKNAGREYVVGRGLTVPSALRDLANEFEHVREVAEFISELEMVQVPG